MRIPTYRDKLSWHQASRWSIVMYSVFPILAAKPEPLQAFNNTTDLKLGVA